MIVSREEAVQNFTSESFYTPEIDAGSFTASGEKLKDAAAADAVRDACDGRDAVCLSVEKQKKAAAAPKLYDLTTLQREAKASLWLGYAIGSFYARHSRGSV